MKLRPHQVAALAIFEDALALPARDKPLFCIPTGGGKSIIAASFAKRFASEGAGRTVIVCPTREIVQQVTDAVCSAWGAGRASLVCSGLQISFDTTGDVIVGTIQSLANVAHTIGNIGLVIIDEAHAVPPSGEGMYRRFLNDMNGRNRGLRVIGLTATPYRLDQGLLHQGKGSFFSRIAYEVAIDALVQRNILCPLVTVSGRAQIDTGRVAKNRKNDFSPVKLSAAARAGTVTEDALKEVVTNGASRKSWLLFFVCHEHAQRGLDFSKASGVQAEGLTASTSRAERSRIIGDFRSGKLRALCNVDLLALGYDAPRTDLVAILRPTMSTGRYVQMVGRGLRTSPGKVDCLILDFGGNIQRHGPLNALSVQKSSAWSEPSASNCEAALTKDCPTCSKKLKPQTPLCAHCGYVFSDVRSKFETSPILVIPQKPVPLNVGQFTSSGRFTIADARKLIGDR